MKRLLVLLLIITACTDNANEELVDVTQVVYETDSSGLFVDVGLQTVQANCTPCHSGRLIAQNRATREGWKEMITWMQEKQNLWPLGENEAVILDYLEKHYAPVESGRRANVKVDEWYELQQ